MHVVARLTKFFTQLISETSGLSLDDTLALAEHAPQLASDEVLATEVREFRALLGKFRVDHAPIEALLSHSVARALAAE